MKLWDQGTSALPLPKIMGQEEESLNKGEIYYYFFFLETTWRVVEGKH